MANNFKIVISATDRATSTVRKVNDAMAKLTRPFSDIKRSVGMLGKEVGRNPLAKGLSQIARAARIAASSIARVAVPMAGLVGFGSLAGITAMVAEWGLFGFEIDKTARNLGMATSELQALRGAAQLAGVSSEELTSGVKALGDTMEDALAGRNQAALLLLNKLNVQIHKTSDGSIDAARGLKDIAAVLSLPQFRSAQVQGVVARSLGIEALLPLLRKGRDGIEELQQKVAQLGGVQSNEAIQSAARFGEQLLQMKAAVKGLSMSIGSALMPVLQPLIDKFSTWVALNRDEIGSKFSAWVEDLRKYDWSGVVDDLKSVGTAIASIASGINAAVEAWHTWRDRKKETSSGVTSFMGLRFGKASEFAKESPAAASTVPIGIRNNNPGNLRRWGNNPTSGGYAVFSSPVEGIAAMARQLQLYQGRGIDTLRGVLNTWAPPSENNTGAYVSDVARQTGNSPDAHLNLRDPKVLAPLVSAMIRHENGQNPYDKSTIDQAVQTVVVEFRNAPPGTSATARSESGKVLPVRISHAMPTLAAG